MHMRSLLGWLRLGWLSDCTITSRTLSLMMPMTDSLIPGFATKLSKSRFWMVSEKEATGVLVVVSVVLVDVHVVLVEVHVAFVYH